MSGSKCAGAGEMSPVCTQQCSAPGWGPCWVQGACCPAGLLYLGVAPLGHIPSQMLRTAVRLVSPPSLVAARGAGVRLAAGVQQKGSRETGKNNLLGRFKAVIVLIWKNSSGPGKSLLLRTAAWLPAPVAWPEHKRSGYFGERARRCKAFPKHGGQVCPPGGPILRAGSGQR